MRAYDAYLYTATRFVDVDVFDGALPLLEINALNVSLIRRNMMLRRTCPHTLVSNDVSPFLEYSSEFLNHFLKYINR